MRNATIATSRTRATDRDDDLIDYRPLPSDWGDAEALRAVRAARTRAAELGRDPSTVEIAVEPERAPTRPRRGLLGLLRRGRGAHRRQGPRGSNHRGHLAAA